MLQYTCLHRNLQKSKNFVSEILKHTRSRKPGVEEAPRIKGFQNKNIQDTYNLTPKTLPVYYADVLLTIAKNMQGKK